MKKTTPALALVLVLGWIISGLPLAAQEPAPQQEAVPQEEAVSALESISFEKVENQIQVMIKVAGQFSYETFELIAPRRLVIDFSPVTRIAAEPILQVNDLGLLNIRTGQFQPTVARVVFDMDAAIPSHSISPVENGLKVVFWQEELPQPETKPQEQPEVETKPEVKPEEKPAVVRPKREGPGYFVRAGLGLGLFLKPDFVAASEFTLYGETATLSETYNLAVQPVFDLCFGKFINARFLAGLGVSQQTLSVLPTLEFSLPHPFEYDSPRRVTYEEEERLSAGLWTIYGFGLYSVFQTEKIEVLVGPVIGFSFGQLFNLDDYDFSDTGDAAVITSTAYLENDFFKIDPGLMVVGQYPINKLLAATATLRIHYVDVMIENLGRRASLFRANLLVGLQASF